MATYRAPLRDMQFLLQDVFQAQELFGKMPGTQEVSDDLISAIVEEAGKIAEGLLAPINQSGDQQGCRIENGVVNKPMPPMHREAGLVLPVMWTMVAKACQSCSRRLSRK
jgi:hypothetical protein